MAIIQQACSHGGDIYSNHVTLDFSVNVNPLGTPESVVEALRKAAGQAGHYPDPFCRKLVKAISDKEGISPESILCGNGGAELIYAFCDALRPRKVMVAEPSFSEYTRGVLRNGTEVVPYLLQEEKGFFLDDGILGSIEAHKPEVIFLCNPNNPDGQMIPAALREEILRICEMQGIRLFLDECFLELSDGFADSMVSHTKAHPGLFVLKAFTKSYALAGVRLGYGICSDLELMRQITNRLQPWNVSVLAQEAGLAALQEEQYLEDARALIQRERTWLARKLAGLGFRVCPSHANYLLFHLPEGWEMTPGYCPKEESAQNQISAGKISLDRALLEEGILIRNCSNYPGLEDGWYRVSIKTHEENQKLLQALERVMRKEWMHG